jgi:CTP:molybdopterin cytidylyltransferase MocA
MGRFKPLLDFGGRTLIEASIASCFDGGAETVLAVLGFRREEAQAAIRKSFSPEKVIVAVNPNFTSTDMFESIKIGLEILPDCDAFFLLPADMPMVKMETFQMLARAMEEENAQAAFPKMNGRICHPPLIRMSSLPYLMEFKGEGGMKNALKALDNRIAVEVDDEGCLIDADKAEDYEKLKRLARSRGIAF